jgi:hypothetical protein
MVPSPRSSSIFLFVLAGGSQHVQRSKNLQRRALLIVSGDRNVVVSQIQRFSRRLLQVSLTKFEPLSPNSFMTTASAIPGIGDDRAYFWRAGCRR